MWDTVFKIISLGMVYVALVLFATTFSEGPYA
jgi:hypothetical protein